ncbi:MAG: hypothetical protein QXG08_07970 [Candidatus Methanomethyliaceae archaeon]
MPKVKSRSLAKSKYAARVKIAAPEFEAGLRAPRNPWLDQFKEASDRIHDGLREAIEEGRITAGAERRGTGFWQKRAVEKGVPRWREIMPKVIDDWEKEVAPYLDAIETVVLEKKRKKGDPANIMNRVAPIVAKLRETKKALRGVRSTS